MKLIYRVTIRLAAVLFPILLLWATIFYFSMVDEINDETDDSLEDYAELIVRRTLTGRALPTPGNGSNNTYTLEQLPAGTQATAHITFTDKQVYIPEKSENEPARELSMTFEDEAGHTYRLTVSTPTFERKDLIESILILLVLLYLLLVITILITTALVFHYSMRPLYSLLHWLDRYTPGKGTEGLPTENTVIEFRKLTLAARHTIARAERYMERQSQFIGNASHELQTPLAVIGTRIEWIIDNTRLSDEQFAELSKIRRSLHSLAKLNRTLLLLSKIENGQFPERREIDLVETIKNEVEIYTDIYADRELQCTLQAGGQCTASMDDSLATTLVTNLLKNAFLHTPHGGTIEIKADRKGFTISNDGESALDSTRIFDRFYTKGGNGSTGLGLALVKSIAKNYGFNVVYEYKKGRHSFSIKL